MSVRMSVCMVKAPLGSGCGRRCTSLIGTEVVSGLKASSRPYVCAWGSVWGSVGRSVCVYMCGVYMCGDVCVCMAVCVCVGFCGQVRVSVYLRGCVRVYGFGA